MWGAVWGDGLVDVLRHDPADLSTPPVAIARAIPVDMQAAKLGGNSPADAPQDHPGDFFTRHVAYIDLGWDGPDVRVGDWLVDASGRDEDEDALLSPLLPGRADGPDVYVVVHVRSFDDHLEIAARKVVAPWSPATGYASDETGAYPLAVFLSNNKALASRRDANDFTTALFPVGTRVVPGALVQVPASLVAPGVAPWYVVMKVGLLTPVTLGLLAILLPLPYQLSVAQAIPPSTPDGQRRFDNSGAPLVVAPGTDSGLTQTTTIRGALSTNMDMRQDNSGAGPIVTAIRTILVPLGSHVAEGAGVTVGTEVYRVANAQIVSANGMSYALQVELKNVI